MVHVARSKILMLLPALLIQPGTLWGETLGTSKTPSELRESLLRQAAMAPAPFVFTVFGVEGSKLDENAVIELPGTVTMWGSQERLRPLNMQVGNAMLEAEDFAYWIHLAPYPSRTEAIEVFIESLSGAEPMERQLLADRRAAVMKYPVWPDAPRVFWGMQWKGQAIGQASYGKRAGGWPAHALYSVTLFRGNRVLRIECSGMKGDYSDPTKAILPDPREIALELDRYYAADPIADLAPNERERRRMLRLRVEAEARIVAGHAYPLQFPFVAADDAPSEIRIRLSHGEVWEVVPEDAAPRRPQEWVPVEERKYSVRFAEPGLQTLTCYHINATGECTAWGELHVEVVEPPAQLE